MRESARKTRFLCLLCNIYHTVMELTSLDYVRLISWISYFKHGVILNKTQMQKLLFICYGLYLSNHDTPLFLDDAPKAWPFGPVFPRSYKRYAESAPSDLSENDKRMFLKDRDTLRSITGIVDQYCSYPANILSEWSHQKGSPWAQTVFSADGKIEWNKPIEQETIKNYFNGEWRTGL